MPSKKAPAISESAPAAESLFSRLLVAPILFVSFLISLFLIDRHNYSGIFARSGSKDGYYHSHQRKLAKQEMDEAFRMRRKVIAAMCMLTAVSLAFIAWGIESVWTLWRVRA
ncbi:uncharacterized protein Z518_05055 [Rhinocladiella mackenziei CBS 650.93]|uniref:Uncharacterized protein n=1 Tax=Rhinocladiella mackenziei CBS 650.93 TaxID=1442369 RepID=A0A0D2H9C3_9EURO|nr:uncharacterized protein Z518_05055 [Rhinocladiella mackenziei CBS 650.93]KIX07078.1 hypothetical protein Z518_05055 [Rhinocladiella mackenziei CBS 650.93]